MVDPGGDPKAEGGWRRAVSHRRTDEGQSKKVFRGLETRKLISQIVAGNAPYQAPTRKSGASLGTGQWNSMGRRNSPWVSLDVMRRGVDEADALPPFDVVEHHVSK